MRNLVIFDGSNFYHKCKQLVPEVHLTHFNYHKLAELATGSQANLAVEYCVGEIRRESNNKKSALMYDAQMMLFYTLIAQNVAIKKGFMLKAKGVYHEKGVDVRIATDIVRGALKNEYDICYLVSSDSDLVPAIEDAMEAGKIIVYAAFENSMVSKALANNSSRVMFITKSMLEPCA